jgi:leader peptidase (prepilin peptidase)/N-methyltransferase
LVIIIAIGASLSLWLLPTTTFSKAIPNPVLAFFLGLITLTYFGVVFIIDLEHRLILHPVSIFGVVLCLGVGWLLHGIGPTLLGGLGGFGIMLFFYMLGTVFARIRTRRMRRAGQESDDEEALGAGDVILAGVLGLILGWPLIWFGLLMGILLGGLITIPMLVIILIARRYKQDAWMVFIPYGPFFLISATLILYLPNLLSTLVPK